MIYNRNTGHEPFALADYRYTRVFLVFDDDNVLELGRIDGKETYDYIEQIKLFEQTRERCVRYGFSIVFYTHQCNQRTQNKQSLTIKVTNKHYMKCPCGAKDYTECFKHIKDGTCADPFVRENFGKKFYRNTYILKNNYFNEYYDREASK